MLTRRRLLDELDTGAALTVVRGPTGAGKTVLLADWARQHRVDRPAGLWVTVVPSRTARTAFWSSVLEELDDAGLTAAGHILHAGADVLQHATDVASVLRRGFRQLGPLTIIVDDASLLGDEVLSDIVDLVVAVPTLRMIAGTRRTSILERADARLATDVSVVPPEALALTVDETVALLSTDEDDARRIRTFSDGSPLVTRALALDRAAGGTMSGVEAVESRMLAVLSGLDERVQQVVRSTAVAEVLTLDLANALAGVEDCRPLLDDVEEHGLGMWSTRGAVAVFSYTTAFRLAVRNDLRSRDPRAHAAALRLMAQWAIERSLPLEAMTIAHELDDLELASQVVRVHWGRLMALGGSTTHRLFGRTSLAQLRRYPLLAMVLALTANARPDERMRAVMLFGIVVAGARTGGTRTCRVDRLLLRSAESVALRLMGRPSARSAEAVSELLGALSPAELDECRENLPSLSAHTGLTFLYAGRTDRAIAAFESGRALAQRESQSLHSRALLAGTHALAGRMRVADEEVTRLRNAAWPEGWVDGYVGSFYQLARALHALESFDTVAAQESVDAVVAHLETIEHWALFAHVQAMIDLASGEAARGLDRLDATRAMQQHRRAGTGAMQHQLDATRSVLLLATGQVPGHVRSEAADRRTLVARARVELLTEHPDRALQTLDRASLRDGGSVRTNAESAVLTAAALLRTDDPVGSEHALARMASLLDLNGLRFPLALVPATDRAAMLALARERDIERAVRVLTDTEIPDVFPQHSRIPSLTEREVVVLHELVHTASAAQIAERLQVSPNTVKSQLRGLYLKLGVSSRARALATAQQLGLLARSDRSDRSDRSARR